jgi:DNA polymerase-3 subunit alpha
LDCFGSRPALLDGIDRIISVSAAHFRAVEMGQMSLFGMHTGVSEEITLPLVTGEISRRELLSWEKDLIGLYVSDHPLSPVINELTQAVSHFSAQLSEVAANERVRVAGMIIRIRHHQSKAGKPMGFVAIEDLQGTIELVIFPSIWAKFSDLIVPDGIILVEGRADTSGAEPKVLVDSITTDFSMTVPLESASKNEKAPDKNRPSYSSDAAKPSANKSANQQNSKLVKQRFDETASQRIGKSVNQQANPSEDQKQNDPENAPATDISVEDDYPASAFEDMPEADDEMPPAPEPPPDWELYATPEPSLAVIAASMFAEGGSPQPAAESSETAQLASEAKQSDEAQLASNEPRAVMVEAILEPPNEIASEKPIDRPIVLPPYLVPPAVARGSEQVQMVTVVMRASGDKTRDVLRLRRIHGTVMSFPGNDRFAFHVFERNRGYLLEFPNFTTGICADLIAKLQLLVGSENVRVEPITFQ